MERTLFRGMLGLAVLLAAVPAQAIELYRYVDEGGAVVFDRHGVPPHLIGNGYEVLNDKGRVLRVVAPAPTADERQRLRAEAERASGDARLLRLYGSVEEVEAARQRKLAQIDGVSGVARANLAGVKKQLQRLEVEEHRHLQEGREVPGNLVVQIQNLRQEQAGLERNVEAFRLSRLETEVRFGADRERLAELLGEAR